MSPLFLRRCMRRRLVRRSPSAARRWSAPCPFSALSVSASPIHSSSTSRSFVGRLDCVGRVTEYHSQVTDGRNSVVRCCFHLAMPNRRAEKMKFARPSVSLPARPFVVRSSVRPRPCVRSFILTPAHVHPSVRGSIHLSVRPCDRPTDLNVLCTYCSLLRSSFRPSVNVPYFLSFLQIVLADAFNAIHGSFNSFCTHIRLLFSALLLSSHRLVSSFVRRRRRSISELCWTF